MGLFDWIGNRKKVTPKKRRAPGKRFFEAGRGSVLTGDWPMYGQHIDHDLRTGLSVLRNRARHEAQNNDHVAHFLRLVRTNVIGPNGIRYQSRVHLRNGKLDRRLNDALEAAWKAWSKRGSPDVTGRKSWHAILCEAATTVARDGEAFYRIVRGWEGNRFRLALQSLDPETLDINLTTFAGNGNRIVMGVELDEWRRPVAYYFTPEKDYTRSGYSAPVLRDHLRLPASDVLHLYLPEWVWQTRGIPWTATAILKMYMLRGYQDAEVTAARVAAAKMGFYVPTEDAAQFTGDGPGENGTDGEGSFIQDVSAGEFEVVPYGYSVQTHDPQHPNSAYGAFVKDCLRGIASGMGVNYNTLANDLEGVNYTSLRHGLLNERDVWMMLQKWMLESFVEPVFSEWLTLALTHGQISTGTLPVDMSRIDDLEAGAMWQPRRWPWVDPLKDSQANKAQWDMRTKSLTQIITESGQDPDEVFLEIAADMARLEEYGITMQQEQPSEAVEDDDEEEPEQDDSEEPEDDET